MTRRSCPIPATDSRKAERPRKKRPVSSNRKRILLIEDNPSDALLMQAMLKHDGAGQFDLILSDRLDRALELLREPFDAILLDLTLPDSKGLSTLELLLHSVHSVPIVVVTGAEDEKLAIGAILQGAQDYLVKGTFDGKAIIRAVRYAIERKRADEARSYLASIVESSEDGIIGEQLDGTITSWNSGAERIFGYSPKEVIGRSFSILIPPERSNEFEDILDKMQRGERLNNYETQRLRKDGSTINVSLTVSPIVEMNSRVIGASAIARDITESKQVQEERDKLLESLQDALSKVRLLSGLLPICANCKRIRDERGNWNHLEVYIQNHSEAEFTHGICPTCCQKLYPELGPPPDTSP